MTNDTQKAGGGSAGTRSPAGPIKVDIWADVACPWCYVGKRKFEAAAKAFAADGLGEGRQVEVEFHSFELAPNLPLDRTETAKEYHLNHMGMNEQQADAALARMARVARKVDVELNYDTNIVANTVLAHQLIHYAKARGKQLETEEALFQAFFTDGRDVSDIAQLAEIAEGLGLDRGDVIRSLEGNEFLDAVRADESLARSYGIGGVPFLLVGGKYGLSGAQEATTIQRALEQAWSDRKDS
ncbi:putative DsbA family dithiol-disulfide isomerase [Promicromonospora sp. AC04]|uniref:DsbA family oxidoreductase n=1 Tax=Promicromonospora sp. AC04 TaxID=2135723 RepID=UPI000D35528C|nr:DsbA family oxidoreductase [Promicromonospora sp. AC04]PUB20805.1 putative DsbA family dithiol-disulfide isomerase [Promicromonospora sp. AC04]